MNFIYYAMTILNRTAKLINETVIKNPKTIIILINGSPISMCDWIDNVPVIIEAWYYGMEGGRALADIIFGDINPSGKLPITFPKKLFDSLSIFPNNFRWSNPDSIRGNRL